MPGATRQARPLPSTAVRCSRLAPGLLRRTSSPYSPPAVVLPASGSVPGALPSRVSPPSTHPGRLTLTSDLTSPWQLPMASNIPSRLDRSPLQYSHLQDMSLQYNRPQPARLHLWLACMHAEPRCCGRRAAACLRAAPAAACALSWAQIQGFRVAACRYRYKSLALCHELSQTLLI